MKLKYPIKSVVLMLLLFVLASAQDINDLKLRLSRTQLSLNRLERTVNIIPNPLLKDIYQRSSDNLKLAWQYYYQHSYLQSDQYLALAYTGITRMLQILKDNPLFNRKQLIRLEKTLRKAERAVNGSNHAGARYFLETAYDFKQQGLYLLNNNETNVIQAVELLVMAQKFAEKAIKLAVKQGNGTPQEKDFRVRIRRAKNRLQKIRQQGNNDPAIRTAARNLKRCEKLHAEGNLRKAERLLRKIEKNLNINTGRTLRKVNGVKLFRQYQQQIASINRYKDVIVTNEVSAKLLEKIQDNLQKADRCFSDGNPEEAAGFLTVNHQLLRTLQKVSGEEKEGISANITRRIAELRKELAVLKEKVPEAENKTATAEMFLEKAEKANQNGHIKLSTAHLRAAFKIMTYMRKPSAESVPNELTLKNKLSEMKLKIEKTDDEKKRKILRELAEECQLNLDNNKPIAANTLLNIMEEILNTRR